MTPDSEVMADRAQIIIDDELATSGCLTRGAGTPQVMTMLPAADLTWEYTDSYGHYHARSTSSSTPYPTLLAESVRMDCDGGCGGICEGKGYSTTVYTCLVCGELVEPGIVAGPHHFAVPGPADWSVDAQYVLPSRPTRAVLPLRLLRPGDWATVQTREPGADGVWRVSGFGVALVTDYQVTTSGDGKTVRMSLAGAGVWGRR